MTTLCKTLRPFAKCFPLGKDQINNWTAHQREISKHGALRRGGLSQEPQVTRASKSLSRQCLHLRGMNSSEVCLAVWNMEILDKTQDISHDDTNSGKKEKETQTKTADLNSPELQCYPALSRSAFCDWFPQVRGSENHSLFLLCFQNVELVESWILLPILNLTTNRSLHLLDRILQLPWLLPYSLFVMFYYNSSIFLFLFFCLTSSSCDADPLHQCILAFVSHRKYFSEQEKRYIIIIKRVITLYFQSDCEYSHSISFLFTPLSFL